MNYAKLLEINSFFTWHIFLEVGKTQDMPSKIWQTLGDAPTTGPRQPTFLRQNYCYSTVGTTTTSAGRQNEIIQGK